MVSKTVVLQLERVLCGVYEVTALQMAQVFSHLLSLSQVDIEDRVAVQSATTALALGFDLADALHHVSYRTCSSVATFDDKGFARRNKKSGTKPAVFIPQA